MLLNTLSIETLEIIFLSCVSPCSGYLAGAGTVELRSSPFNFRVAAVHHNQELKMTSSDIQFTLHTRLVGGNECHGWRYFSPVCSNIVCFRDNTCLMEENLGNSKQRVKQRWFTDCSTYNTKPQQWAARLPYVLRMNSMLMFITCSSPTQIWRRYSSSVFLFL